MSTKTFENTAGYSGNLPKFEKKMSAFASCAMHDEQALNNLKRRGWDCVGAATNANSSTKLLLQYKSQYCCKVTTVMTAHAVTSAWTESLFKLAPPPPQAPFPLAPAPQSTGKRSLWAAPAFSHWVLCWRNPPLCHGPPPSSQWQPRFQDLETVGNGLVTVKVIELKSWFRTWPSEKTGSLYSGSVLSRRRFCITVSGLLAQTTEKTMSLHYIFSKW